jgi:hypothetical protein
MTIPDATLYPDSYDTDENLFLVRDALRVRLLEDYKPGDTSVLVEGDEETMARFPPSGIITLTEQCSDIDFRAVSLHYASRTSVSFDGLELLPEFAGLDSVKPKKITNVTMNVVAMHHNHLKDSLVATQSFLGTKRSSDLETMTGRISRLESLAFRPKTWFSVVSPVGLAPLGVEFENQSFRLGPKWNVQTWSFGDGTSATFRSETPEEYASLEDSVGDIKISGTKVFKIYSEPGVYTVGLSMENEWGVSEVEFQGVVTVKAESPEEASISIVHRDSQSYTPPDPSTGSPPRIRSVANSFVDFEVRQGADPSRDGYSYAGEKFASSSLSSGVIDPVVQYTWNLGDDLPHTNSPTARASYSLGGLYDVVLRVDTSFGSYRITRYEDSIDILESRNLWLFNFSPEDAEGNGPIKAYEFGLASETFKVLGNQTLALDRNNGFLDGYGSEPYKSGTLPRARAEFDRNVEFVPSGTAGSGARGNSLLFWAKGGAAADSQEIGVARYNAFDDVYESLSPVTGRPWNWVALNSPEKSHFLFGGATPSIPNQNQSFAYRTDYDLSTQSAAAAVALGPSSFENGADELLSHASEFDPDTGIATNGGFATYRSAWKDSSGYILRNSAVNEFFRLSGFYRTNGSLASPFNTLTRLPNLAGSVKVEGQLVSMSNGVFMFNNSGEVCAWNDTSLTWEVGRAGSSSLTFRSVQDTNSSSFDDGSNTLLASSDGDRMAYLSYDYSDKAFVKFNGVDLTFSTTRYRPPGRQFKMGVY